jgi:hypothetical protein
MIQHTADCAVTEAFELEPVCTCGAALRQELEALKLAHDNRKRRVANALEMLRETFTLRPGCNAIEDAAEDACADYQSRLRAVEGLCIDLAQAFESATPDAYADSAEADSWDAAKRLLNAKQPDWQAEVQAMRERRDARLRGSNDD